MDPEILVSIQFRLPQADRRTLAEHLSLLMKEAVAAGVIKSPSLCNLMIPMKMCKKRGFFVG